LLKHSYIIFDKQKVIFKHRKNVRVFVFVYIYKCANLQVRLQVRKLPVVTQKGEE